MTAESPWLDIYVLCHNRPGLARETIRSILAQNERGFRLIISDNSTNEQVAEMVGKHYPELQIIHRGGIPPFEHFNACIREAQAPYFCLFHDDDLMEPDFVKEMRLASTHYPQAVAIGGNAWVIQLSNGVRESGILGMGRFQKIQGPARLFERYFGRHQTGIAPFPSYVYQTQRCQNQSMLTSGGKYADVSWLLSLAAQGLIVWCNTPLMQYHLHGGNDGMAESLRDRLRFLAFMKQHPDWCSPSGFIDYRYFLYQKILAAENNRKVKRPRRINWLETQLQILRQRRKSYRRNWRLLLRKQLIKTLNWKSK